MLKAIGTLQLALAPLFVVPAMTGQDETTTSLRSQLDATLTSIEYLSGLRANAEAGTPGAVAAVLSATQAPNSSSPERATRATTLQNELARLRFEVDKLLADPAHVAAITSLPPRVVNALGLGGSAPVDPQPRSGALPGATDSATGTAATGPGAGASAPTPPPTPLLTIPPRGLRGLESTTGLDDAIRTAIRSDVGPLDNVAATSRRRGGEPVPIEGEGFVADPSRLGKLLVRAERPAEAVEVLEGHPGAASRYWLGRAYQALDRDAEAIDIFTELGADPEAGVHARYAIQDLDFLRFRASFERARAAKRPR